MFLYHGSQSYFTRPSLACAKGKRDFGYGFYLAERENDAASMCYKNGSCGYLYTYYLSISEAKRLNLNVLSFDKLDDACALYIYRNRILEIEDTTYDIVIGPTAGGQTNKLFSWIRRENIHFEKCRENIIKECSNTSFGRQWCFKTKKALSILNLVETEDMTAVA